MGKNDVRLLKQWINPLYLVPQSMTKIQHACTKNSYIQLADFLLQMPKKLSWKTSSAVGMEAA